MVAYVVAFFADVNLMGFDLMNEPLAGTDWQEVLPLNYSIPGTFDSNLIQEIYSSPTSSNGTVTFDKKLTSFYCDTLIPAIREIDSGKNILWPEPAGLFGVGYRTTVGFDCDNKYHNVGFNFHNYNSPKFLKPFANANRSMPLLMTEFGAERNASIVHLITGLADRQMIPWIFWAYVNDAPFATSRFLGDSRLQALVVNLTASLHPPNLAVDTLDALTRVYPLSVAGTPLFYSYNVETKMFNFSYSTAHPNKGGGETIIVAPICLCERYAIHIIGGAHVRPSQKYIVRVYVVKSKRHAQNISVQLTCMDK